MSLIQIKVCTKCAANIAEKSLSVNSICVRCDTLLCLNCCALDITVMKTHKIMIS